MAGEIISHARLRELLSYDHLTGVFTWVVDRGMNKRSGKIAGAHNGNGYLNIQVDGRGYLAHRLAWFYVHESWPPELIDHRDGDGFNNKIKNLRLANRRQNGENQRQAHKGKKSSKFIGVYRRNPNQRWCAMIRVGGMLRRIGLFDTEEGAHAAYIEAKRRQHEFNTI